MIILYNFSSARIFFLNNKDKFREYGVKYYDENKYNINRRRLFVRINKGLNVRMSSLDEYDIDTKECDGKCKKLV